ncbi:hypothetical protein K8R42_04270, partial [bacterium]|nr:hypothetical protein [bacterium]
MEKFILFIKLYVVFFSLTFLIIFTIARDWSMGFISIFSFLIAGVPTSFVGLSILTNRHIMDKKDLKS